MGGGGRFYGAVDMPIAEPPFILREPDMQASPLVLASPHSGRNYTAGFVESSRLDARALRRSEDSFVDELYAAAPAHGAALLTKDVALLGDTLVSNPGAKALAAAASPFLAAANGDRSLTE